MSFDRKHRVLMTRFTGNLRPTELAELDHVARAFIEREGPVHGLIDFSEVSTIELPAEAVIERGQQKHLSPGHKRVFIARHSHMSTLARLFAIHQELIETDKPRVVETMEEALAYFGFGPLDFEPVA